MPIVYGGCKTMSRRIAWVAIMVLALLSACTNAGQPPKAAYLDLVDQGEFAKAEIRINELLKDVNLSAANKAELEFEIERMQRIRKDFTGSEAEVVEFIKAYIPDVGSANLAEWETEKSLEMMKIDGEKRYFKNAARNLFRINKACIKIWDAANKSGAKSETSPAAWNLDEHIKTIIRKATPAEPWVEPVRLRIDYTITVNPDVVPAGETIRCWIPFPREIPWRQTEITIVKSFPGIYQVADNANLQRTVYLEQPSAGSAPTRFNVVYEYTACGTFARIDPEKVVKADSRGELQACLQEEPPNIVFTPELRTLSQQIVGEESNPYRIAQKLYAWVEANVPWASAREYSTIRNLPMYAFENHHGDCGIQNMTFLTLCRINGIPARWQSGWEFKPPASSMHDWGMIYFAPYGWLPMDATYGQRETEDPVHRWFYLSGMDSYRLIFNDGYAQAFAPPKQHFRSETIDSQRGEVEWKGGNLYFDQWDWDMKWEVLKK
jgi:transglutaminase-like putative cysteine protease